MPNVYEYVRTTFWIARVRPVLLLKYKIRIAFLIFITLTLD